MEAIHADGMKSYEILHMYITNRYIQSLVNVHSVSSVEEAALFPLILA